MIDKDRIQEQRTMVRDTTSTELCEQEQGMNKLNTMVGIASVELYENEKMDMYRPSTMVGDTANADSNDEMQGWVKPVDNIHKMLEPAQAGNPGCAVGGGTTCRLPGCWEGPQTNLLLTGVMPQPHGSPTSSQLDSQDDECAMLHRVVFNLILENYACWLENEEECLNSEELDTIVM